jgi:hypothetical protein
MFDFVMKKLALSVAQIRLVTVFRNPVLARGDDDLSFALVGEKDDRKRLLDIARVVYEAMSY